VRLEGRRPSINGNAGIADTRRSWCLHLKAYIATVIFTPSMGLRRGTICRPVRHQRAPAGWVADAFDPAAAGVRS